MKKQKLLIIGLISVVFIGIGSSLFFFVNNVTEKKESNSEKIDKNEDVGMKAEKDIPEEELSGEAKVYYDNMIRINQDKDLPEYPDGKILVSELRSLMGSASYDVIMEKVEAVMDSYKFTEGENITVATIYNDANIMINTMGKDKDKKGEMVTTMRDPEMMAVGTLMLPEYSRRFVITQKDSLTPLFEGKVDVMNHEFYQADTEDADAYVRSVFNTEVGTQGVHKIDINIIELDLLVSAYIIEYSDGTLSFYGIYADENEEHYEQTIEYYEEVLGAIEENMQKNLEN